MKELEKTKRISISTVVFILVILIGFLAFQKPKNVYKKTLNETLEVIKAKDYLVSLEHLGEKETVFIDVRSKFEYAKGHINKAINIPTALILEDANIDMFKDFKKSNTPVVLYGEDPDEGNNAWMLLYQLGFDNVKLLNAKTALIENKLEVKAHQLEKPIPNYNDIFKTVTVKVPVAKKVVKKSPIKVIPKKKKKKKKPEGGC